MDGVIGAYEREAIRPHVFGRFRELLAAAVLHPAMLVYLDAHRSVGPTSAFGARTGKGLNENLAREVLELHTLGVDGGYDHGDVRSFASVLTGWGVDPDTGVAAFRSGAHEPGAKVVYGARVDGVGADEVREMLDALARHEATARHVCTRIARHFVADAPPREAVDALVGTWLATEGDLGAVAVTLVDGPWGWEQAGSKLKSPWEWVVSLGRALGAGEAEQALKALKYLGQRPWDAPSPAGWPDVAAPWIGPEGIARRLELALEVGRRVGEGVDPAALGEAVLGPLWGEGARQAVRAAPGKLALAALLASPDMQRR